MSGGAGRPTGSGVRVRFAPSPTGNIHVGNIRTALFNHAFARHHGGTFVFRIEDTDRERSTEESYAGVLSAMRWLGLDWDEGPEVGGPHAPYRQSERLAIYASAGQRLRDAGYAYDCFCTAEEVAARAAAAGRSPGYDGFCRSLPEHQREAFVAAGRVPALRFRMPGRTIVVDDLIRGEVGFTAEAVPDYVLVRADGHPLYTLVNPVDDALMGITHVLRGEDLLSSTPRQIALYEALGEIGVGSGVPPLFGHLPFVMGEGNAKLSKRNPEASLDLYRRRGFLPEGLLNYLALLGWSFGDDREIFSMAEMAQAFDVARISRNPARFDLKKCEAVNAEHVRRLPEVELRDRIAAHLTEQGWLAVPPTAQQQRVLELGTPLVQTRMVVLEDAAAMLAFALVGEEEFAVEEAAAAKVLAGSDAAQVLRAARDACAALPSFDPADIEASLRAALVEGLGLKPKAAYAPIRVAITGRTVSPPLFESMAIIGRERCLARLDRAVGLVPA